MSKRTPLPTPLFHPSYNERGPFRTFEARSSGRATSTSWIIDASSADHEYPLKTLRIYFDGGTRRFRVWQLEKFHRFQPKETVFPTLLVLIWIRRNCDIFPKFTSLQRVFRTHASVCVCVSWKEIFFNDYVTACSNVREKERDRERDQVRGFFFFSSRQPNRLERSAEGWKIVLHRTRYSRLVGLVFPARNYRGVARRELRLLAA